jgi:hypothetical protein
MRALDCECGQHLEAANDEELFEKAREHMNRDHPNMQLTYEQVRRFVAGRAYDKWVLGRRNLPIPWRPRLNFTEILPTRHEEGVIGDTGASAHAALTGKAGCAIRVSSRCATRT